MNKIYIIRKMRIFQSINMVYLYDSRDIYNYYYHIAFILIYDSNLSLPLDVYDINLL